MPENICQNLCMHSRLSFNPSRGFYLGFSARTQRSRSNNSIEQTPLCRRIRYFQQILCQAPALGGVRFRAKPDRYVYPGDATLEDERPDFHFFHSSIGGFFAFSFFYLLQISVMSTSKNFNFLDIPPKGRGNSNKIICVYTAFEHAHLPALKGLNLRLHVRPVQQIICVVFSFPDQKIFCIPHR